MQLLIKTDFAGRKKIFEIISNEKKPRPIISVRAKLSLKSL